MKPRVAGQRTGKMENFKKAKRIGDWRNALAITGLFLCLSSTQAQTSQSAPSAPPTQPNQPAAPQSYSPQIIERSSAQFLDASGLTVERLVEIGLRKRADLLAARQRLATAEGRLIQAGLRPNPTLDGEYGSPRFLAGEAGSDLSVGVSQTFELGGKRDRRRAVARLELAQVRAEVLTVERSFAAEIRTSYARAVAAGRQLDQLESLITANEELVRVTKARLTEGDVAPFDLNLVQLETDRLRAQVVRSRAELEGEMIILRALVGFEMTEPLQIAPLAARPPRLDLSLTEATEIALRERADLQAARLGEELGTARIRLAESQATPNVAASVRYSRNKGIVDLPERSGGGVAVDADNELTFGVSVDIPIFNRNQGEIAAATSERVQIVRQREFLEATVRRDVALAYLRYRAAAEGLVLYSTQIVPRAEASLRTLRAAYNLGEFSVFEIVNEQRRLIESETGLNDALRDYYAALAELERALGTTLPPSAFAPASVSALPDASVPHRDFSNLLPTRTTTPLRPEATQSRARTQPKSN